MKKYFHSLVSYNAWANRKLVSFIVEAGEESAVILQKSSFSTIRETAFHIWDAEGIWLKRLKGESIREWPSKNFSGSTSDGLKLMIEDSHEYVTFLNNLEDHDFLKRIDYTNLSGSSFHNTIQEILAHVMNHSTFHRGQLVTMLRVAGYTHLKSTDMITFYREGSL